MVPGLNWFFLIPTGFHVVTLIMGVKGDIVSETKAGASRQRLAISGAGLIALVVLSAIKTQSFFDTAEKGPPWERAPAQSNSVASTPLTGQQPEPSDCSADNRIDLPQASASSPQQPYYDWHRCPGEGCSYPQGLASAADTVIHSKPDDASSLAFSVKRGTRLIADDGVAITVAPGQLIVTSPFLVGTEMARVGESVFEYTNYGEGFALTQFRGKLFSCPTASWMSSGKARRAQEPVHQYWAKVRDAMGRGGWVRGTAMTLLAGGGESAGCGHVPADFFTVESTACR